MPQEAAILGDFIFSPLLSVPAPPPPSPLFEKAAPQAAPACQNAPIGSFFIRPVPYAWLYPPRARLFSSRVYVKPPSPS